MIHISTNSGATWIMTNAPEVAAYSVACSADGTKLILGADDRVYTSANSGATWTPTSLWGNGSWWTSVGSSSDGSKLLAVAAYNPIYTSAGAGKTWAVTTPLSTNWQCVASSADGGKLLAGVGGGVGSGLIYTSQSAPAPALMIAPSGRNLVLSWIVPSMNFVLQQNSGLNTTNWTDVAKAPTLNLTNLQYQVTMAATNAGRFYRLKGSP